MKLREKQDFHLKEIKERNIADSFSLWVL